MRLSNRDSAEGFFVLQSGLAGPAGGGARPTHLAPFSAAQTSYELAAGSEELRVPLTWSDASAGVRVTKTFVFRRGQYRIDLEYSIENSGSEPSFAPAPPGDAFWQLDLFAGWRSPRRRLEAQVGILNLTDQDYRLSPISLLPELPRERALTASLRFNF